jgi:predicted CoA-substrate-specific enzyme activase
MGDAPASFVGIDLGSETTRVVEVERDGEGVHVLRRHAEPHGKQPGAGLRTFLAQLDWPSVRGAAATGRLARLLQLPRVPVKQAQLRACRFLFPATPVTLVSIGARGFSVLSWKPGGAHGWRENGRCAQGTGNFLGQLTGRLGLSVEAADRLAESVESPLALSGRCPVILKSDLTHLASGGQDRDRLLAGLFDAIAANVLASMPRGGPPDVVLIGGVGRCRRVRRTFARSLRGRGMALLPMGDEEADGLEALGAALLASDDPSPPPLLDDLLALPSHPRLDPLPPLAVGLPQVHRLPARPRPVSMGQPVILGLDVGSTGTKLVALDAGEREALWEGYRPTGGDPIAAAQGLLREMMEQPEGSSPVLGIGVTGSGRELVGAALAACHGAGPVLVLNEIVAHAEGTLHHDPRADTVFEIGGQDAKYIRLAGGHVVDCALNEACSAGTGSFIEEQGSHMGRTAGAAALSLEALAAPRGVGLGQHCSVFMAQAIDEACASGVSEEEIVAGIFDSVARNYLHRVKGDREVGEVLFCQGMPFASNALPAAVARLTGRDVHVPPSPGMTGALGVALAAARDLPARPDRLDPTAFLGAVVERRGAFTCRSTAGCGGTGIRCRIATLRLRVGGRSRTLRWGGACPLHEGGRRRVLLPDGAPDPFRERAELAALATPVTRRPGRPSVAMAPQLALEELFPFWVAFVQGLGFDVTTPEATPHGEATEPGPATASFCAPVKLFHQTVQRMVESGADRVFVPMVRCVPRVDGEPLSRTCPVTQAAPDLIRAGLEPSAAARIVSPVVDLGPGNLASREFLESCRRVARSLGSFGPRWRRAWRTARRAQEAFDRDRVAIGRRALAFCTERDLPAIVVLGPSYAIHRRELDGHVPAVLRELGAIAIPLDCLPEEPDGPVYPEMYWGQGQRLLRAARHVRGDPDLHALLLTSQGCGPDSLHRHFVGYLLEGKPHAVLETDGHRGEAGVRTRVEAFLHCVRNDRLARPPRGEPRDLARLPSASTDWPEIVRRQERVLIPSMGHGSEAAAAALRGLGLPVESLPPADRESLRLGQRHTTGNECLPMILNLGALLRRLEAPGAAAERFVYLMPRSLGPCRFGLYSLLLRLIVQRLGLQERVRIWSPVESGYFDGLPPGSSALLFVGIAAADVLDAARMDVRPAEARPGAASEVHDRWRAALLELLEQQARAGLTVRGSLWEVACGRIFGVRTLLAGAAADFAAVRRPRALPRVLVVGEIFARIDAFASGGVVEELERRGMRARRAGVGEWLEYIQSGSPGDPAPSLGRRLSDWAQRRIQDVVWAAAAARLGWPRRRRTIDAIAAARGYVRPELCGEAVLTVGASLHEWRSGSADGAVSVGTWGCMHNRIAEAQLACAGEREGLVHITLPLDGDPVSPDALDDFAFEVHAALRADQPEESEGACTR